MSTIPVIVPNLPSINKDNPALGEAVKKLQDGANLALTDNRVKLPANSAFDPTKGRG